MSKECRNLTKTLWTPIARMFLVASLPLLPWACEGERPSEFTTVGGAHKVPRRIVYPNEFAPGLPYSPGVLVGETLYIAGQTDLDSQTGDQADEVEAQVRTAMDRMGYVLNKAGMDYGNVVTCHVYLADMANYQTMNKVYGSYFEAGSYPARTTLEMPRLPSGARIQVSCIAYADRSQIRVVTPRDRSAPVTKNPLSQGVWAGDRLYLAGRGGRRDDTGEFDDTVEAQTQKAMEKVGSTLADAGLSFQHVVFANPYFLTRESYPKLNSVWKTFFELGTAPSRASFCISRLPGPESLVQFALVATSEVETKGRVIPQYMRTSPTSSGGGVLDGDTLWTSGKSGQGETLEEQLQDSLEKIRDTLRLAGMDLEHVVQAHIYLKDVEGDMARMDAVFQENFPQNPPARTTVQVIQDQFEQVAVVAVR
jgi:2-iminobutanoate/2-iminopropanoate deaminase